MKRPRKKHPAPFYRRFDGWFYVQIGKEQIKLTWWNNQPMARTKGLWESVVADVEAANPNVKIETVIIPFDDFEPKIMTGLAGKNVGDLVDVHPVHAFTFAMRGALVDLNRVRPGDRLGQVEGKLRQALLLGHVEDGIAEGRNEIRPVRQAGFECGHDGISV